MTSVCSFYKAYRTASENLEWVISIIFIVLFFSCGKKRQQFFKNHYFVFNGKK